MKYPAIQYHDYLKLDQLLDSQSMRSEEFNSTAHDEMLFIIVHQTYELWFKQMLFELDSVLTTFNNKTVSESDLGQSVHRLKRIVEIQKFINGQIDILETMTPLDFLEFRDFLFPASGFQSLQWRLLETKFGLKPEDRLTYNQSPFFSQLKDNQQKIIKEAIEAKSLLELIESWLERTPFLQDEEFNFWESYKKSVLDLFSSDKNVVLKNPRLNNEEKNRTLKMIESSEAAFTALFDPEQFKRLQTEGYFKLSYKSIHAALLILLYRDQPIFQKPFELIQSLLDLDENMTQWRYRHSLMVHRMLGKKIGTGGSSGHDYLKSTTDKHKIFSDFFNLSTFLIPRSKLPRLPESLIKRMQFNY